MHLVNMAILGGLVLLFGDAARAQPPPPPPQIPSAAQRVPNPQMPAPDGAVSGEPANQLPGERPVPPLPGNVGDQPPGNPPGPPPLNAPGPAPRNPAGPPPLGAGGR